MAARPATTYRRRLLAGAVALACCAGAARAEVLARRIDTIGQVVTSKGDEQLDPVEVPGWRRLDTKQRLAVGDNLLTGPYGGMGILFRDETQIRIHSNTRLQVREVGNKSGNNATDTGNTKLQLERGAVWMRARSIPNGLSIETPSATVSVRGTDWSLAADDDGAATLIVLSGQVRFFNEFGEVLVERGESAHAEKGRAPVKRFIVQPGDQAQWQVSTGWLDFISLTGKNSSALREELRRGATGGDALLQRAYAAHDLMEYADARRLLDAARGAGATEARTALVGGLLALQEERVDDAAPLLAKAMPAGRREEMALHLARYGVLVRQRELALAETALAGIEKTYGDFAEAALARAWNLSFLGKITDALPAAQAGRQRFPGDARFPALLAHLHMLLGETGNMRAQLDAAQALDATHAHVLHLDVLYHLNMRTDLTEARRSAEHALEIAPNDHQLWNDLGLACQGLGDHRAAEHAFRRAIALQPAASEAHANLAILLITLDRLREAESLLQEAITPQPSLATASEGMGLLALAQGRNDEALEWLLKTALLNPGLSEAQTLLAAAHYREERFAAADKALDSAIRFDTNDPLPYLLKSIAAQDSGEAGNAIRYARSAFDAYLKNGEAAVNGVQNRQSGDSGLAAAYNNLGLAHWGDSLAQRAYNPYWANSHFSVQAGYASDNARLGSLLQGLLLDPAAVSYTPRHAEFGPRRPRNDVIAGVSVSSRDGAIANNQSLTTMGFMRDAGPLASLSYFVSASRSGDPGAQANADARSDSTTAALGAMLNPDLGVLLRLGAGRSTNGMPGSISQADTDDRSDADNLNLHLGVHKRLGFHDELFALGYVGRNRSHFRNADPYGTGMTPLGLSLATEFGVEQARAFYRQGLVDASFDPALPMYAVGATLPWLVPLADGLPAVVDRNTHWRDDTEAQVKQLQLKRLFDAGPLQMALGAEWAWTRTTTSVVKTVAQVQSNGVLLFPDLASIPPAYTNAVVAPGVPAIMFPFASSSLQSSSSTVEAGGGQAYANLRWPLSPRLLLEAGVKLQHLDDGRQGADRWNPQAGLAWQFTDTQSLRLAQQRFSRTPVLGMLAPMTTVGLGVPDSYVAGTSTSTQLQLDSEWNARAFTFARLDRQEVDGFLMPSPDAFDTLAASRAEIRSVTAGANLWLGERWGLSAQWREQRSRNLDAAFSGKALPLLPQRSVTLAASWVHPAQLRLTVAQSYTGPAEAELANSTRLPAYWLTNVSANWQPLAKHWSFTLSAGNLLDRRYRIARDIAGSGRTVMLAIEYRS